MALSISVRCTLLVIAILFAGIFTGCLPVRERLAARAERSGGDYRAERRSLASIALAEYLYHFHTNTGNNIARSGFCIRGWLPVVSVLGTSAIWRNLKNRRNAPSVSVRCTLLIRQRTPCSESRAFGWQLPSRTPKPCKVHSCRTLIPFPHNTRNNAARSDFCIRGWLFAVSVLGVAAIRRNLKNRRNAPPISVRCTLLIRQRTPCSESRAFGWQLPSRTPKPCKVRSCRTPIPFPHKYRKQHCPFRFLHQRTAVCCICSGNYCNQAKFEYAGRESSNG